MPPTPLFTQGKNVVADLRRHGEEGLRTKASEFRAKADDLCELSAAMIADRAPVRSGRRFAFD
jgi:hypothetical protein